MPYTAASTPVTTILQACRIISIHTTYNLVADGGGVQRWLKPAYHCRVDGANVPNLEKPPVLGHHMHSWNGKLTPDSAR